jgi:hypothetical protein
MEQLKLTKEELKSIGFEKCISEADELNTETTYYKIKTMNGYFYYNPYEKVYTWYHKTIIGDFANDVHLDITQRPVLFSILQAFKANFEIVI